MGLFSKPRKRRTKAAVLRSLEAKIRKKQKAAAKKKAKADLTAKIEKARKTLRGY